MVSTQASDDATLEVASRLRLAIARTARRLRQSSGTDLTAALTAALATVEARGPLTPSALASVEHVKRPTATRIVARLEEQGLVERTADPGDRRSFLVEITADGRALLRRLRKRKNAYLARRLRELEAEDVATLERAAGVLEHLLETEPRA
ncbi:MAG: MarR family transcriptional regulator [Solirubrobacterales bacterium]